jgi:uncharacterized membrane protein
LAQEATVTTDKPTRRRRGDLSTPRGSGLDLAALRPGSDGDAFGRFSESVARFFGTARFLVGQTLIVAVWISLNALEAFHAIHYDPYPFILLNLVFSTQAAYAAPLILLAQNRQAQRERASVEEDREVASRTQADAEFLGRELSSLRIAMSDVVTTDDLTSAVEQVRDALQRLETRLAGLAAPADAGAALKSPAVPAGLGAAGEEADHPHEGHDHGGNP